MLRSIARAGLKITGCAAIIVALGMAFVILTPKGEVEEAGADIYWTGPASLQDSKQVRFIDLLDEQGFSEPQPYDWNGNVVFFSHGQSTDAPRQVAARLQETFLREGINDRALPLPIDPAVLEDETASGAEKAYAALAMSEFFTGGMIPIIDTGDHVAFSSVEVAVEGGNIDNLDELVYLIDTVPLDGQVGIFDNFRYVEVFRPEGGGPTQQIAIFGDERINFNRFQPGAGGEALHRDTDVAAPACPNCERVSRFSGMESQEAFEMVTYNSSDTIDGVLGFYRRAMLERGWEISSAADVSARLHGAPVFGAAGHGAGEIAVFERDARITHVHAYPAERGVTHVNVFQGE